MRHGVGDFPLVGEPLAVDLVNTVVATPAGPRDLLETPSDLAEWLRAEAGRLPPGDAPGGPGGDTLAEVRALREALRALCAAAMDGTAPPPDAVAAVNRSAAGAPAFSQLVWPPDGPPRAEVDRRPGRPGAVLLAAVAASGIDLLTGDDRLRLRPCDRPGCVLLFVAANPRRRWCSPAVCGNRVRVARHYRRYR